jgi:hypothetical protein
MGKVCCKDGAAAAKPEDKTLGEGSVAFKLVKGETEHPMNIRPDTKVEKLMTEIDTLYSYKNFKLTLDGKDLDPAKTIGESGVKDDAKVLIEDVPEE